MTKTMIQTWSPFFADISKECQRVFDKAFEGFTGYNYTPIAVASQLVTGINYKFFCNAKGVYPGALNQSAMITIYVPAGSEQIPHITDITIL